MREDWQTIFSSIDITAKQAPNFRAQSASSVRMPLSNCHKVELVKYKEATFEASLEGTSVATLYIFHGPVRGATLMNLAHKEAIFEATLEATTEASAQILLASPPPPPQQTPLHPNHSSLTTILPEQRCPPPPPPPPARCRPGLLCWFLRLSPGGRPDCS